MTENSVCVPADKVNAENEDKFNDKKLTLALSKLLDESLTISDDTILEKLFTHLVKKIKSDGYSKKTLTVYVIWLSLVMKRWEAIQGSIQVFGIRLAGVVCSTPVGFLMMEEQDVITMFTERVRQQSQFDSSIMLAVVHFITEAVKHEVGCNWVIQTEIWKSAVKLCHTDTSLYTSKASAKFIANLLLLFEQSDIEACRSVVDAVLKPLCVGRTKESPTRMDILNSLQFYVNPEGVPAERKNETAADLCQKTPISKVPRRILLASIKFFNEVLDALLMSKMSVDRINNIFKDYSLEMWAWEQVHVENKDVELLQCLCSTLTLLNFLGTEHSVQGEVYYTDMEVLSIATLRLLSAMIYKKQYNLVFDICVYCLKLKHLIIKKVVYKDEQMEKSAFDFGNQLLIIQSLPLFVFVKVTAIHSGDIMDKYAEKLFSIAHNETTRTWFKFRDLLRVTPNVNMGTLCQLSVISMMKCIDYVNREQAVIIFQTMIHTLRQFVPESCDDVSVITYQSQCLVQKCPILLMHLLEGITIVINKFHITWSESLETLCLLTFSQALIMNPNITPRLSKQPTTSKNTKRNCVKFRSFLRLIFAGQTCLEDKIEYLDTIGFLCTKTLKVIQQLIENFLPPNLALLVDTLKNSSIESLGSLLLAKLGDNSWEVRDSTLEVLQVIGRLSDEMFPAFQTLMFEPNLLDSVVSLVVNDMESYVRGTAMICLCDLIKVQNLWDRKLSTMALPEISMGFMKNDTEGLVRKAACHLGTTIYKHQNISSNIEKAFHHVMLYAAINDLHWEVKTSALDFWEAVLDHELTNEGMIDGVFPGVTFSKQSKKIINLTVEEIHKRLVRVLEKLGEIGCLQVLWTSLHDEWDLEVVRAAVRVIHKLMNLLVMHSNNDDEANVDGPANRTPWVMVYDTFGAGSNFTCEDKSDYFSDSSAEDEDMPLETSQNADLKTDNVIKQIVEHNDLDLLSTVYKLNSNWKHPVVVKTQQTFLTPKQFLANMSEIDVDEIVNSRSSWLENSSDNLGSLLDDVLAVNCDVPEHINNVGLDCY